MANSETVVLNGRYELHSRIARGGMAEVFLARDQLLDRQVAVKVLFQEFAGDPAFVERFRREAQAAANLNHPNIVAVYDWGSYEGTYFIVMEYVRGRSLADILRREGTLHPDRAADIAADIAGALYFAHRHGVVHRDVKPGNVLVTPQGQVKVTDFGIARAVGGGTAENLTQTGSVMGTATYLSPEQAQGLPVDPRSDLYALGVVLYESLLGRPPFSGESPVAIAYQHVQTAPTPPRQVNPAVPPPLEAITLKLLAKNPANRYPTGEELRADLRRFREGQPVAAEPVLAVPIADPGTGGADGDPTTVVAAATASTAVVDLADQRHSPVAPPYGDVPVYEGPRRHTGIFVGVVVALVVVLGVLVFLFLRELGGSAGASTVAVPNVVGRTFDEASAMLEELELRAVRVNETTTDPAELDRVLSQDPVATMEVEEGSEVALTVGAPPESAAVPEVVGLSEEEARSRLEAAGFGVTTQPVTVSDSDQVGVVIGVDPPEGEEVPLDTEITIQVGVPPSDITLPSVAGLSVSSAIERLVAAGVSRGDIDEVSRASSDVPEGQVIGTDPSGSVPDGGTVTLIVSDGPERVEVPELVNLSQEAAENALADAGLKPRVEIEEDLDPGDPGVGRVIDQNPEEGDEVEVGSTVTIVVGEARPATTTTEATTTSGTSPTTGTSFTSTSSTSSTSSTTSP